MGRTKFGEHYGKEPEKLIEEAWLAASQGAGIERKDLEAFYMSDCFLPITNVKINFRAPTDEAVRMFIALYQMHITQRIEEE